MHAKMTRDRKKCFIAALEKTIEDLQSDIEHMKDALSKVTNMVTPMASPEITPLTGSLPNDENVQGDRPHKRARHGFSLEDC